MSSSGRRAPIETGDRIDHYTTATALHAYNTIISLPISIGQRAWLLRALHEALDRPPPPPALASALCARGRIRRFRQLRQIPSFGRRRHAVLRRVFAAPALNQHLSALLAVLTDHPPAQSELDTFQPAHPFGEAAAFPPVVARLLGQDGRLLYGRARPLDGFGFCKHILDYQSAVQQVPASVVVIGAGYVGVELALAWGRAGSAVTVLSSHQVLLVGYPAPVVAEIRRLLLAAGVRLILGVQAERWQRAGGGVAVTVRTADGPVVLHAARILVAAGIVYPRPPSG